MCSRYDRPAASFGDQWESRHPPNGFTLVELLIVLAILAVVLVSAPSMIQIVRNAQVQGSLHAMASSLALARASAISRNHPVTLCPSDDGLRCAGGTDWTSGWIVYLDSGRQPQPRSPSEVLEVVPPMRGGLSMRTSAGRLRIRYQPSGWASGSNLALTVCTSSSTSLAGRVVVNNAGRSRTERADPGRPCPYRN